MSPYTAEDFAATQERYENSEMEMHDPLVVVAALRIAARVMTPGLIGKALIDGMLALGAGKEQIESAIRSALTEENTDV